MRPKTLGNIVVLLALTGCITVQVQASPEDEYLRHVGETVTPGAWTDDELLGWADVICEELDRTNGDVSSMLDGLVRAARANGLSGDAYDWYRNDMSAIMAGAGTWICPEWKSVLPGG